MKIILAVLENSLIFRGNVFSGIKNIEAAGIKSNDSSILTGAFITPHLHLMLSY